MPQFYIRLQEGIAGGFKAPTPRNVIEITNSGNGPVAIKFSSRKSGTKEYTTLGGEVAASDSSFLDQVGHIKSQLKSLPVGEPNGADVYALDTGISFGSDDMEWSNAGPQGCRPGNHPPSNTPTEQQRESFKSLVEQIKALGGQYAVNAL